MGVTLLASLCRGLAQDTANEEDAANPSPNNFILEYDQSAHLQVKRDEELSQREVQVLKEFHSSVFKGAQVSAGDHALDDLATLPGVVRVGADEVVTPLKPIDVDKRRAATDFTLKDADNYQVHRATGVDELHKRAIHGKGVKVGVVDTGIWYDDAALGCGFGEGSKVAGGWDYVGDGWIIGDERVIIRKFGCNVIGDCL